MHRSVIISWVLCLGSVISVAAQEPYQTPPQVVRSIIDAPQLPTLWVSPDRQHVLLGDRAERPSIADLAQPMLRLAGLRLNPQTNGRFTLSGYRAFTIRELTSERMLVIPVPENARLSSPLWSPDGSKVAFTNTTPVGIELWIADVVSGEARKLTETILNGVLGDPCNWMPNGQQLLCRYVVEGRNGAPQVSPVPAGPIVQRTSGQTAPVATYQDLLKSPHDEALFDYYATSQLHLVDVETGEAAAVGPPAIFQQVDPSPSGDLLLIARVTPPYSYLVPVSRFGQEIELWNTSGQRVLPVTSVAVGENIPIGGVRTGPRQMTWRPDVPATLVYAEALDGGDTRRPAEMRDRVVSLAAPFTTPLELGRLQLRFGGITWGLDGLALLAERERSTRRVRTWRINADDPSEGWRIIFDYSTEDRYNDPGTPVLTTTATGARVLLQSGDGDWIYLRGSGASETGDLPFFDRLRLDDRRTDRLWQSADTVYELVVDVLDDRGRQIITRREDRTSPPNYLLRNLRQNEETPLTAFENPAPVLATVRREMVRYQRADGVGLSGTLYYPTDYQEGQQVPVIFWIYPREFASAQAASQVRGSPNRFLLPGGSSHLFLLTQGYAVLDNPTLPVVGGEFANDTYVEQTVAGAEAAVSFLMEQGIADGNFGVGGHSYGAFATANLLAHSDLFRAGVARSGAYNRTLTPFGFQNERRTFWEARDVYLEMMPFTYANRVNEPILLIHGMNDNNSGTFPVQSDRMYRALKGHGGTVEYVQLPYESHGYVARESVFDVVARMIEWFDRYVKGGSTSSQ